MKIYNLMGLSLIIALISITLVSGMEWDNVKSFNNTASKYGKITIDNAFGLPLIGGKIADYTLINLDASVFEVSAQGTASLYTTSSLFEDAKFLDKFGNQVNLREFNIFILKNNQREEEVIDWDTSCNKADKPLDCFPKQIGTHNRTINYEEWVPYNYETLGVGNYTWRIEGTKERANQNLDFILTAQGKDLSEWAWWNISWTYKQELHINTTYTNIGNLSVLINITYNPHFGSTNFSDLRFINSSETGELGWEMYNGTFISSNFTQARVFLRDFNLTTAQNLTIYMYYGNQTTVGSTANISQSALFGDGFGTMDTTNNWISASPSLYSVNSSGWLIAKGSSDFNNLLNGRINLSDVDIEYRLMFIGSPTTTNTMNEMNPVQQTSKRAEAVYGQVSGGNNHVVEVGGASANSAGTYAAAKTYRAIIENPATGNAITRWRNDTNNFNMEFTSVSATPTDRYGFIGLSSFDNSGNNVYNTTYDWIVATRHYEQSKINYYFGPEQQFAIGTITQVSPVNAFNISSLSVNFTCNQTAGVGYNLVNTSLLVYNASNFRNFYNTKTITGVNNETIWTNVNLTDGEHNWACDLTTDDNSKFITANRTLRIDTIAPTITIHSPIGEQFSLTLPYNVTLNATSSDINLQACYYNSTINTTYTIYTCNTTAILTVNTTGIHSVNLCANDSLGNARCNSTSFYKQLGENNFTYNATIYETDSGYFKINLSNSMGTSTISGSLYYNGSRYAADSATCSGLECIAYKTLDIPTLENISNITRTFYWNLTITNSTASSNVLSSTQTHIVNATYLRYCGTIPNVTSLNFTAKDELNATILNFSLQATYEFWLGGGSTKANYSFADLTNSKISFPFCILPPERTFKTNLDLAYSAIGYGDRQYFLSNASINNVTNDILLYLLNVVDYQKFFITVKSGVNEVQNAIVTIKKYNVGTGQYTTVGIRRSDTNGQFIEYLDLDNQYRFTVVSSTGEVLGSVDKNSICEAAPCEMTLQLEASNLNGYTQYYNTFAGNILYNLSYNNTNKLVIFDYIDTTGLATYVRLQVEQITGNNTGNTICDTSLFSVSGTITCNMTGNVGEYKASTFISRSPEKLITYITFVIGSLSETLNLTGILIDVILSFVIIFAFVANFSLGVISVPLSMTISKLWGLFPVSWTVVVLFWIIGIWIASKGDNS